ncbi:MAG: hypothetical protein LBQ66_13100 [Planctomycetaceae bacterium]|nr:hypothetical protein [Planctomycetaceae bacterium]
MPMRVPPPLISSCFARRKHNRPAVGCLPYVADTFSAPLGGKPCPSLYRREAAANLCGIMRALTYAMIFYPFRALM